MLIVAGVAKWLRRRIVVPILGGSIPLICPLYFESLVRQGPSVRDWTELPPLLPFFAATSRLLVQGPKQEAEIWA